MRIALFILLFASSSTAAVVQDEPDPMVKASEEYNRLQNFFNLANNSILNRKSVEPIPEQVEAFKELLANKQELQTQLSEVFKTGDKTEQLKKLTAVRVAIGELKRSLMEDVLLPHQALILQQKEFTFLLEKYSGDYAKVIENYYGEEFNLTRSQKVEIEEVKDEFAAEKSKLEKEFREKLKELETKSKEKLSRVFDGKQRELILGI